MKSVWWRIRVLVLAAIAASVASRPALALRDDPGVTSPNDATSIPSSVPQESVPPIPAVVPASRATPPAVHVTKPPSDRTPFGLPPYWRYLYVDGIYYLYDGTSWGSTIEARRESDGYRLWTASLPRKAQTVGGRRGSLPTYREVTIREMEFDGSDIVVHDSENRNFLLNLQTGAVSEVVLPSSKPLFGSTLTHNLFLISLMILVGSLMGMLASHLRKRAAELRRSAIDRLRQHFDAKRRSFELQPTTTLAQSTTLPNPIDVIGSAEGKLPSGHILRLEQWLTNEPSARSSRLDALHTRITILWTLPPQCRSTLQLTPALPTVVLPQTHPIFTEAEQTILGEIVRVMREAAPGVQMLVSPFSSEPEWITASADELHLEYHEGTFLQGTYVDLLLQRDLTFTTTLPMLASFVARVAGSGLDDA